MPGASPGFGTLAVYVEPDDIWLFTAEAEPHLLTQGGYPQLSPDGCRILFQRPGDTCYQNGFHCSDRDYWLINVDGSGEKWLYSPYDEWSRTASVTWSPNGTGLAVTTTTTGKTLPVGDLYWINASDGTVTQLVTGTLQGGTGAGGRPYFSPDGHWIATTTTWDYGRTQSSIGLVRAGSPNSRLVFFPQYGQDLTWANDSSGFVAALYYFERLGELELWWAPVEGEPTQLGEISAPFRGVFPVLWQPGGERLAYTQFTETEESTIHLAARDGSQDVTVPGSTGMKLWSSAYWIFTSSAWSPDGNWLLLEDKTSATQTRSRPHVYVVNTQQLNHPQPLDAERVYGWLDATHYLASNSKKNDIEFLRCNPKGDCESLGQIPVVNGYQNPALSYVDKSCTH